MASSQLLVDTILKTWDNFMSSVTFYGALISLTSSLHKHISWPTWHQMQGKKPVNFRANNETPISMKKSKIGQHQCGFERGSQKDVTIIWIVCCACLFGRKQLLTTLAGHIDINCWKLRISRQCCSSRLQCENCHTHRQTQLYSSKKKIVE